MGVLSMCELQPFALGHMDMGSAEAEQTQFHRRALPLLGQGGHEDTGQDPFSFVSCGVGHHPSSPVVSVGSVDQLLSRFPVPTL